MAIAMLVSDELIFTECLIIVDILIKKVAYQVLLH